MDTRSNTLRIAPPTTSGSWSISSFEILVDTFASSVCTSVFSATTFTESEMAPRFRVTSIRAVAPAASLMPSTLADWKPWSEASMR